MDKVNRRTRGVFGIPPNKHFEKMNLPKRFLLITSCFFVLLLFGHKIFQDSKPIKTNKMNENTAEYEQSWADDLADRVGIYEIGSWMSGFLGWIDENGGTLQAEEGTGWIHATVPKIGLFCTLKPSEGYSNASEEEKHNFLTLYNVFFDTKRLLEFGEALPFGLNYQGETIESVKAKLNTNYTYEDKETEDGQIRFILYDTRVVELTFSEDQTITQIIVTRAVDYENEEDAYYDAYYGDEGDEDDEYENEGGGGPNFVSASALPYDGWCFVVEQMGDGPDRLCFYGLKTKQKQTILGVKVELSDEPERHWESNPVDIPVQKVTLYHRPQHEYDPNWMAMISESGEIVISRGIVPYKQEDIPEVRSYADNPNWSFLANINQIGDNLYACGSFGQVYKRFGDNDWRHVDNGLLQAPNTSYTDLLKLYVVAGANENAIYAAGAKNDQEQTAKAFFYDGKQWKEIKLPKEAGFITDIYVESEDKIWMCGEHGTLLLGNAQKGFKYLSDAYKHRYFSNISLFKGVLYIASDVGILAYKPGGMFSSPRIEPVHPDLDDHIRDVHTISSRENVIWFVGKGTIVRFDGKKWHKIY